MVICEFARSYLISDQLGDPAHRFPMGSISELEFPNHIIQDFLLVQPNKIDKRWELSPLNSLKLGMGSWGLEIDVNRGQNPRPWSKAEACVPYRAVEQLSPTAWSCKLGHSNVMKLHVSIVSIGFGGLTTWWFIPRIVSGLVHPSYEWTLPPPLPLKSPGL